MTIKDQIAGMSTLAKTLAVILLAAILAWLYVLYVIAPLRRKAAELEDAVAQIKVRAEQNQVQVAQVAQRARSLETAKDENERMRRRLTEAQQKLPNDKNVPQFLKQISAAGPSGRVKLTSLTPLPAQGREEYMVLPLKISLRGDYASLGRYLAYLEDLPRLVAVSSIALGGEGSKPGILVATLSAETYILSGK